MAGSIRTAGKDPRIQEGWSTALYPSCFSVTIQLLTPLEAYCVVFPA